MLLFDGLKEGTRIKAWDFRPVEGREDSYVIGIIISDDASFKTGYESYEIYCTEDSHNYRVGDSIFVPKEVSLLEWDERIEELPTDAREHWEDFRKAVLHREKSNKDWFAEQAAYEEEAMYANLRANGGC